LFVLLVGIFAHQSTNHHHVINQSVVASDVAVVSTSFAPPPGVVLPAATGRLAVGWLVGWLEIGWLVEDWRNCKGVGRSPERKEIEMVGWLAILMSSFLQVRATTDDF
jgi:hypothetical protein